MTPPGSAGAGALAVEQKDAAAGSPDAWLELVRQAVMGCLAGFDQVEAGRLASLTVSLPGTVDFTALDADSRWLAVADGLLLAGRGRATVHAARGQSSAWTLAHRLETDRASWRRLGPDDHPLPQAFFLCPFPDGAGGEASLWIPQLLLRQRAGRLTLTLTARRDRRTPAVAVAKEWLDGAERLLRRPPATAPGRAGGRVERLDEEPGRQEWIRRVQTTLQAIAAGHLGKAVLARRVTAALPRPADLPRILDQLIRRYPDCNVFALPHGAATLIAASPERLAVKRGDSLVSHALAGTTRRDAQPELDDRLAGALVDCRKERDEHAFVVDAIVASLHEICETVDPPGPPSVMRLHNVQHLWTPVRGRLRQGVGLLEAVDHLHPTPAVAGFPRPEAIAWLNRIGEHRGSWYTGVAGWVDGDGDGEAAVVLRSALVEGNIATLWGGAGIVGQSQPAEELAETELKMAALLDVLAGHE